jgi:hypothetical protein
MVSQAWKGLSHDEREILEDMARRDKARYEREKHVYRGPWRVLDEKQPKRKDPNAPKRPMSAVLAFSNSKRSKVKIDHGGDLGKAELSRILAQMWKDAPEEDREVYIDKEFELRRDYKIAIAHWRKGQCDFEHQEKAEADSNNDQEGTDKTVSAFGVPAPGLVMGKEGEPHYPYPYYYVPGYQQHQHNPFYAAASGAGNQYYQQPPPAAAAAAATAPLPYYHHMPDGAAAQHPPPPYYWPPPTSPGAGHMQHPSSCSGINNAYPYYQSDPQYSPPSNTTVEDNNNMRGGQHYTGEYPHHHGASSSALASNPPTSDPSSHVYYNDETKGSSNNSSSAQASYGFLPHQRQYHNQQQPSYYYYPTDNTDYNATNHGTISLLFVYEGVSLAFILYLLSFVLVVGTTYLSFLFLFCSPYQATHPRPLSLLLIVLLPATSTIMEIRLRRTRHRKNNNRRRITITAAFGTTKTL